MLDVISFPKKTNKKTWKQRKVVKFHQVRHSDPSLPSFHLISHLMFRDCRVDISHLVFRNCRVDISHLMFRDCRVDIFQSLFRYFLLFSAGFIPWPSVPGTH